MVKRFLTLLLTLLLPVVALAERPVVVDDANLFTASEEAQIEAAARTIVDTYQVDVVVVTSYAPKPEQSQAFADDYFDYNGYGVGEDEAGLLYLIDMTNRVPTISTKGVMIDYINDHRLNELFDCSYDALASGRYGYSTLQLLHQLENFMAEGIEEGSFRYDAETGERLSGLYNKLTTGEFIFSVGAGLVVMLAIITAVSAKYQLRGQTYHYDLDTNASFQVSTDDEKYIRSTVVHRNKVDSNHGGGGSGGGMGSSVHTSSSGSFHGGGSGRGF